MMTCRNFLKSYGVWWFPPLVMQSAALLLSAVWGFLVFLIYWISSHNNRAHGTQVSQQTILDLLPQQ